MTARAPAWFETKYVNGAMHVLQTDGYVTKGMTAPATGQKGNEVTWKIAGKGEATIMSEAIEQRPTLNADRTTVKATMVPYEANEWILTTDLERMSEAEQQIAQQTCGYALGRMFDNILFDSLDAELANIATIGTGAAAIGLDALFEAQAQIMAQGVMGDLTLNVAIPFRWFAQLMLTKGFANSDYVTDNPLLRKLGARNYLGLKVCPMPDEYFNVPAANQMDGYMWATSCVGFTTPTDDKGMIAPATRIDYVPEKKGYFVANTMMAAAKTLLPTGIRRLRFSTNAALTSGL
jgi:Phage capsid protein